jgi:hypothetical protein
MRSWVESWVIGRMRQAGGDSATRPGLGRV